MEQNENPGNALGALRISPMKDGESSEFMSEWRAVTSLIRGIYAMVSNINNMSNNQVQQPRWVSVSNAAKMLGISDWNVRRLINEKKLEARKKNAKSYEISSDSVARYLAREL